MSLHPAIIFLGGLVVIVVGAEVLLRGAARIAAMLKLKPILIGMTVVAVGTSAPELAVGITAAFEGRGPLVVANVAGTNIFNILFILGLTAAIRPLPLQLQSIKLDVPVMMASAVGLFLMAWDGRLSRLDGTLLITAGLLYTVALVRSSRSESDEMRQEFADEYSAQALHAGHGLAHGAWNATLLVVGIGLTVLGADLLVAWRGRPRAGPRDLRYLDRSHHRGRRPPVFRSDRMVSRAAGVTFVISYLAYLAALISLRT